MGQNSITSLPQAGVSLYSLDLSYNNMKRIPDEMAISSISYLTLGYNKLTTLENLPSDMNSFYVYNNYLTEINPNEAKKIPRNSYLNYNYLPCFKYDIKYEYDSDWYYVKQNCDQSKQYSCSSKTVSECDELKNNYGICTPNSKRTKCFRYTSGVKEFCDFSADARIEDCEEIYSNETCTDISEHHGFVYDCNEDYVFGYYPAKIDNFLTEIPTSASKLTKLFALDLSGLDLTSLPESYTNFKNVGTLNLANNKLSALPAELGSMKSLYYLNISQNQLTSLPTTIGSLSDLINLDVSHNKLDALPDVFESLPSLSLNSLYIQDNMLTAIPKSFTKWFQGSSASKSL